MEGERAGVVMRTIGPSRSQNASSATIEATSAPHPHRRGFSSTVKSRLVLATDSRMQSVSSGTSDRTSMTSASIPSAASCSAASSARGTIRASATIVTSLPSLTILAVPSSSTMSPAPSGIVELHRIDRLVLEEHHRVGVAHRGREQADRVHGSRRRDDLDAGDHHRPVLDALGVLCAEAGPATVGGADDERERHLAIGHVPALGDLVGDDVPAHGEEVAEHDLGDRPQAGHRRAHRRAEDRLLGDRRVADALGSELLEQARASP